MNKEVANQVKKLVENIVKCNFSFINSGHIISRVSTDDFRRVLDVYGGVVTMPPMKSIENLEYLELNKKNEYGTDLLLWIDGKESDLSLIFDVIIGTGEIPKIVIHDLRVM